MSPPKKIAANLQRMRSGSLPGSPATRLCPGSPRLFALAWISGEKKGPVRLTVKTVADLQQHGVEGEPSMFAATAARLADAYDSANTVVHTELCHPTRHGHGEPTLHSASDSGFCQGSVSQPNSCRHDRHGVSPRARQQVRCGEREVVISVGVAYASSRNTSTIARGC